MSVIVQQLQGGQLVVSIPQALAEALNIVKGQEVSFKIEGSRLYLEKL